METEVLEQVKSGIRVVLGDAERAVYYLQRQQFHQGCVHGVQMLEHISSCMDLLLSALPEINGPEPVIDDGGLLLMFQEIQEAQEKRDYVLLSDLYSLKLIPVFSGLVERIAVAMGVHIDEKLLRSNIRCCREHAPQLLVSLFPEFVLKEAGEKEMFSDEALGLIAGQVEEVLQKGYSVEETSSGFYTLSICEAGHYFYVHTNGQIIQEALQQAQEWLAQGKEKYTFYGLGFAYPYLEMLSGDQNISVQVVEMNRELLFLAMVFAPIGRLYESGRFSLLYDPTGHRLEKMNLHVDETEGCYIFYPALRGITKQHIRRQLEAFFVEESSIRGQKHQLDGNFRKNSRANYGSLEDLKDAFQGKDIVIVAAGPSLDKNIHQLKEKKNGTVILSVGTVLQKLLSEGIRPDYVIIIDSGIATYRQIEGVERCGVPLLFLSTAFSRIVKNYEAEKYMICQKGYRPAEELAEENGWRTVETGGSVVTTAFSLCLCLRVSRIIFVGLDLAYTENADHASGTAIYNKIKEDTGIWVEGTDGTQLRSSSNLMVYKEWLEQRIANRSEEEKKIPVIDATEGGAKKHGMENMPLKKALR